jgi:hypothetical protein
LDQLGSGDVQLTLGTMSSASLSMSLERRSIKSIVASLVTMPFALFGVLLLTKRSRKTSLFCLALVVSCSLALLVGCSNSSVARTNTSCPTCTPSGSYRITVIATSLKPPLSTQTVFTLTVAP